MSTKKRNSDFLVQGSILAIASIVSRIIGLIYRVPLTNIIGDDGNNYYGAAYEIYNILLLISSYSLPLAVSKLVAARMSRGEKRNAYRVFKGALVFALISGTIVSLVVFFGAEFLTNLLVTPQSYLALRVLGPTLLIVAVMGVVRGFFQGMGTMVPSAISQIIEQIVNAIVSVTAAYILFQYGAKVGRIVGNQEEFSEAYGAAGGTLGTGAGAAVSLIFLLLILVLFNSRFSKRVKAESRRKQESYSYIFKILILTIVPVLLSTTVYNISSILDQGIFKNIAKIQGYDSATVSTWWGIFAGKYKVLTNVPIAIASAMAASSVPSITSAFAAEDRELVHRKIASSMRFVMLIAFPCAVGMCVLASPILQLLFGDARSISSLMIQVGGISIIFYSISTLTNGVLQGINRMSAPVTNAAIALVLHIGILFVLLFAFKLNIYAVILANVFFALIMCILNSMSIRKHIQYKQEFKKTYFLPALASLIMGLVVYGVYKGSMSLSNINAISTLLSILVGALVYALVIVKIGGVSESDIKEFPKGTSIVSLLKKFHIL